MRFQATYPRFYPKFLFLKGTQPAPELVCFNEVLTVVVEFRRLSAFEVHRVVNGDMKGFNNFVRCNFLWKGSILCILHVLFLYGLYFPWDLISHLGQPCCGGPLELQRELSHNSGIVWSPRVDNLSERSIGDCYCPATRTLIDDAVRVSDIENKTSRPRDVGRIAVVQGDGRGPVRTSLSAEHRRKCH